MAEISAFISVNIHFEGNSRITSHCVDGQGYVNHF